MAKAAEKSDVETAAPRGKGKLLILIMVGIVLLLGGGGGSILPHGREGAPDG